MMRKIERKKELGIINEEEKVPVIERIESGTMEEEEEYAIIDLEAEARKAREEVLFVLFRKNKNI